MVGLASKILKLLVNAFHYTFFRCDRRPLVALLVLIWTAQGIAAADPPPPPVLISEATSTRAIALESVSFTTQPFSPTASWSWHESDKRTRIILFTMNLALQPSEDLSAVTADAEDASHNHYNLKVEDLRPVPGQAWMSQITLRLNENLGDVGDVLVHIVYRNVASNRVRVGIGHIGGGLPDDIGAAPTPAPPYIINGRITSGTTGLSGVLITLSGQQNGTTTTDNNGTYSLIATAVGDYTITPSKDFYSFTPASKTFSNLSGNRTADFQATRITFTISGQVKDEDNQPLSGTTVTVSGSQQATTTTDSTGSYTFTNLIGGGDFTVTASKADYSFSPASQTFNRLSSHQTVNFSGALVFYTINGRIAEGNNGLSGIPVTFSNGAATSTVTTNESGEYTISLKAHGNYTATPSSRIFNFNPQQLVFNFLNANQTGANFTATRQLYTISGQVQGDQSNNLESVSVQVKSSDSSISRVITTSNGGTFSFTDLPAGYSYTVTPSNTSLYAFTPQATGILDVNLSLSFQGTRRKYTISGRLRDGNKGLDGIALTLTGGNILNPLTTISTGGGNFSFTGVTAGYDYIVTPMTTAFYTFNLQNFNDLLSDQSATLAGTLRSYTISGFVKDENNVPLGGNTVVLYTHDLFVARSTVTDSDGRFTFADVPASYVYFVVPYGSLTHDFTTQTLDGLGADQTLNFSGIRRHFAISGVVADRAHQGVGGVNVMLSGPFNRAVTTDANGNYSFGGLPAGYEYNVTVAKTDYIFELQSQSYYLLRDVKADFTATRTYRISGRVTDDNGRGLIGMTMNLSGAETGKVVTGSDGSYLFTVTTTGNYLLTPSKEQDFYTFTPSSRNLNSLNDHQTANFTATFSPPTSPTYVLEFTGERMNVDYGLFWPEVVELGHFFWEFWAMPGEDTHAKYLLSDGYGGAHALLFGFHYGIDGRYNLFGNTFDGSEVSFFHSDEGPSPGEWGHYAVGWDGKHIITYYNGVPVGKQRFVGPRISPGRAWGASLLGIGGSDHQNLVGKIAQVRGYEESNPRESSPESTFTPQTLFSMEGSLLSYFLRPSQTVADLSSGYNAGTHPGRLRGMNGYTVECPECPTPRYVLDPTAPDFTNASNPGQVNTHFSSPPATPGGALVFDSFSRNNSTYILGGKGGLGATEGGSAGQQTWQTNSDSAQPQPFGILGGRAVLLANDMSLAWVSTASSNGNLDVRVDRTLGRFGSGDNTGLSFRVVDKNNFFFAYTTNDVDDPSNQKKLIVGYYQSGARTILASGIAIPADTWKTLRAVTTAAGSISIYLDDALIYSTTSAVFASATGAGLYNNAPGLSLTNRWDNFTVLTAP